MTLLITDETMCLFAHSRVTKAQCMFLMSGAWVFVSMCNQALILS